jgi:DNA-binding response OmpR family regulator
MVSASDGREAYRILAQDDDFLICIFAGVMPYLGGSELLGYMHTEKRFKRIPKIMMLAVEHSAIPAGNLAAGATAYLQKPISPMHMRAILHMLVNRSREHKGSAAFSVVGSMDIRPEPSL